MQRFLTVISEKMCDVCVKFAIDKNITIKFAIDTRWEDFPKSGNIN